MEPHLRVEIVPLTVPLTDAEVEHAKAARESAVADLRSARLSGNIRDIDLADVALAEATAELKATSRQDGYLARINGAEFPLADFAVQYDQESGTPMLSLILTPDALSIGEPAATTPPPAAVTAPAITSWGGAIYQDPRESIPGWPHTTLAGQVAGHAERVALRDIPPLSWLRPTGGAFRFTAEIA